MFADARPRDLPRVAKACVGGIAAGEPDKLRQRTKAFEQLDEIVVLRHDDRADGSRGREDDRILGISPPEFANRLRGDTYVNLSPARQLDL
ncbi:MAG: hypothetical protein JWM95_2160 [Gemmatimonadetes bacterium]|nr:hypothetical protein [Gemmatimonadota bacterium]